MIGQAFRTALRSIRSKKARSFLTMLGIIIGVSQIIALIGLGQGVKRDVSKEVTELGSNLVFVVPGRVQGEDGSYNPTASLGASTLTESDALRLKSLPEVADSTIMSLLAGLPSVGERTDLAAFNLAVEPSYFQLFSKAELKAGRRFNPEDEQSQAKVMVIDRGPRLALFPGLTPEQVIGHSVKFGKESYQVVGVIESPQSSGLLAGPSFANALFIPYSTAKANIENTQVFRLILKAPDDLDVKKVAETVKATMLQQHAETEDFTVFTQDDILQVIDNILGLITKAIVGLASISLIVGGIGIMNIMLVAVAERTKEIGVRKAVGASNIHILSQFLVESMVITLMGGAIGVAIATLASIVVKQQAGLTIVVDWNSIAIATGFSLAVGVVFGLLPAIRAARKDPIEALRYE